ncbi:MAG: hypothetical protein A2275_02115 [Bacteroidetes bacterium RIFOXYA12_FULL_35_11]|nr:MAG: hypothetical protein A2X01_14050 [Bacteroidetes bacterium GWF2_35_48]OFY75099.1 MAG: hypothetical protein A2275_02115 [Bacteroidetes bacterium RIFOXYA12_FULL_35_11]OFY95766.1 MAG: hypothetical protein A2309_02145 [Bacteroidetes bacterium RIFOXYB2_FULL_35_7]OFZ02051.1 MAG: hypothetical protein A2491_08105 [Bacteroidetes bacterium RIFOXYC12_FULL_35_7]HBX52124.1 hypothetical protein [Bacteroidales bacterium]
MKIREKIFYFLIGSIFCLLFFTQGCKNDDNISYETKLTKNEWQLYDIRIIPPDSSLFLWIDTCLKDDYIKYFLDGTYTEYEAGVKCNPAEPIQKRGTWKLSDDKKLLYANDYKGIQTNYDLLLIDYERLNIQYTDTNFLKYKLFFRVRK